jgi:hypothetical protein
MYWTEFTCRDCGHVASTFLDFNEKLPERCVACRWVAHSLATKFLLPEEEDDIRATLGVPKK